MSKGVRQMRTSMTVNDTTGKSWGSMDRQLQNYSPVRCRCVTYAKLYEDRF